MQDKRVVREKIIWEIRTYFKNKGFLETDTPTLVHSPGMEPHIRPIRVKECQAFLPTSPEFAMKKILAQGFDKIFQICKAYRWEHLSNTHNPEFTILEWYRTYSNYNSIMDDVESMFKHISKVTGLKQEEVLQSWPRITIEECFHRFAALELSRLLSVEKLAEVCVKKGLLAKTALLDEELEKPGVWDDLFFRIMLNDVEPALKKLGVPVIVYDYPESQAALSTTYKDSRGIDWSRRFEVYAGGFELGNAFDELTDSQEQKRRFEKDMKLRRELYGDSFPENPIDDEFIAAIGKLPPTGGIAMGVDRLVMYFTEAENIAEVMWLPSYIKM